jgi:aryl-alcohol dehydrogenase-like predicted oxidoreductase
VAVADYVDIYRPARIGGGARVEDVVGTIGEMVKAGYVRYIGLSEVNARTLRRAVAVHPISDLQIEYSLLSRDIESEILPTARELGVGVTAYGVLSRGLLSGHWSKQRALPPADFRNIRAPRFQGDNLQANLRLVEALKKVAQGKGAEVAQIAIAWVLSRGEDIVALVGARKPNQLAESLAAADVRLSAADLEAIERAIPIGAAAGARYAEPVLV